MNTKNAITLLFCAKDDVIIVLVISFSRNIVKNISAVSFSTNAFKSSALAKQEHHPVVFLNLNPNVQVPFKIQLLNSLRATRRMVFKPYPLDQCSAIL